MVLVEPEIPQNTGSIARLCAATGSFLHLVGKLGFSIDEKAVRRAGLDYWHMVKVSEHPDLKTCLERIGCTRPFIFTSNSDRCFVDAGYTPGSVLVFGKESIGLSEEIIEEHQSRAFSIPTCPGSVRSLNLSNAVSVVVYKALEITGAIQLTEVEP